MCSSDLAMPSDARLAAPIPFFDSYRAPAKIDAAAKLQAFAAARNKRLIDLAFSWLAGRPGVASIIAGATKVEQVEQNASAADWDIPAKDLAEIERLAAEA